MKNVVTEDAIKKRHPEGVALITCKDNSGKVNVTPIGWFTLCNSKPRCWAICLYHKHFSHKVIAETKEYVLCLPSYSQKEDILYCGSVHGWDVNKLDHCKLKTLPSKKIKAPILKDSIACFECKVIKSVDGGDHTLFIGEIVESYVSERKDKVYNLGERHLIEWKLK
ncbi:MAG: Flavin reductase domain protein FMN-binding protein [Parcubacteria group bacterium GW2011_GWA2_31_28]|nr:MAG: Flavin reductase domain protein FMN-binding protein [Parcubacteria group bacterium GW2011_GWA2_31_28]